MSIYFSSERIQKIPSQTGLRQALEKLLKPDLEAQDVIDGVNGFCRQIGLEPQMGNTVMDQLHAGEFQLEGSPIQTHDLLIGHPAGEDQAIYVICRPNSHNQEVARQLEMMDKAF